MHAPAEDLKGIAYADVSSMQRLDLYLPERRGAAVPVVVNLQRESFTGDDARDEMYNVAALRTAGYAVANVRFRPAQAAFFPAGAQDVKAAVRWLRVHATEHGLDAQRIAAWGSAAGAYMAAMLGVSSGQATIFDDATLGNKGVSDAVQAVVALYGPTNFLSLDWQLAAQGCPKSDIKHDDATSAESSWLGGPLQTNARANSANLAAYVGARNSTIPPFYFFHGGKDCVYPNRQSHELAEALRRAGVSAEIMNFPEAGHRAETIKTASLSSGIAFLTRIFATSQDVPVTVTPALSGGGRGSTTDAGSGPTSGGSESGGATTPAGSGGAAAAPGSTMGGGGGVSGAGAAGAAGSSAGTAGAAGTSGGGTGVTADQYGVRLSPPTVTVSGRTISVSGQISWLYPTYFVHRQIAVRAPKGSTGTSFSTAFAPSIELEGGERLLMGTGICDVDGVWTAFATYALVDDPTEHDWIDGPSVSFTIGPTKP